MQCPCNPQKAYTLCCARFHLGEFATTPEELMRSRYSAFALKLWDYLVRTMLPEQQQSFATNANKEWMQQSLFLELTVLSSEQSDNQGRVHFKTKYLLNGKIQLHEEQAHFHCIQGIWYYSL